MKGGAKLEAMGCVRMVFFDKVGMLRGIQTDTSGDGGGDDE